MIVLSKPSFVCPPFFFYLVVMVRQGSLHKVSKRRTHVHRLSFSAFMQISALNTKNLLSKLKRLSPAKLPTMVQFCPQSWQELVVMFVYQLDPYVKR